MSSLTLQGQWGGGQPKNHPHHLQPEPLGFHLCCGIVRPWKVLFENSLLQLKTQKSL